MVLLLLTPVLYQHLQRYNELDLPASLSNSLNDLQSPLDSQRTISHESLVSLIKWQRTSPSTTQSKSKSKGKKKSSEPHRSILAFEMIETDCPCLVDKAAVSSLPALEDTTLAYLLSLTEPYAPPLPPRERVELDVSPSSDPYRKLTPLFSCVCQSVSCIDQDSSATRTRSRSSDVHCHDSFIPSLPHFFVSP